MICGEKQVFLNNKFSVRNSLKELGIYNPKTLGDAFND